MFRARLLFGETEVVILARVRETELEGRWTVDNEVSYKLFALRAEPTS